MFFNELYRTVRFRADDPMRDLHVPRRHRVDIDEGDVIDEDAERTIDLGAISDERIVPAEELI